MNLLPNTKRAKDAAKQVITRKRAGDFIIIAASLRSSASNSLRRSREVARPPR